MTELYDTAPVGLWRVDTKSGRFLHANKTALSILGLSDFKELSNCSIIDFDVKLSEELKNNQEISDFNVLIKRKDGKDVWVGFSAKIHPEEGFVEGTMEDITNQRQMIEPYIEKVKELRENIKLRLEQFDSCPCKVVKIA